MKMKTKYLVPNGELKPTIVVLLVGVSLCLASFRHISQIDLHENELNRKYSSLPIVSDMDIGQIPSSSFLANTDVPLTNIGSAEIAPGFTSRDAHENSWSPRSEEKTLVNSVAEGTESQRQREWKTIRCLRDNFKTTSEEKLLMVDKLSHGRIESIEKGGKRLMYILRFANGLKAVFKPFGGDPAEHTYMPKSQSRDQNTGQDRPKNETEVRGNNSQGWCEIVAYHIDQQLGLDRVPVTVGRPIALQALLDVTKSEFERDTLQRWALFSDVTNQGDAVVRGSVTEWLTGDTLTTPDGLQCTEQWQDMLESFAKHSKTSVVQDPALLKATTTLKVFDFLMLNVDRKKRGNVFLGCPPKTFTHLTSAKKLFRKGCKTLQMDNGLGLYEPACLANYHSLKEYKEALLNSSSKDIGRLYQELPSAFSCVGIEHTLTTALHNTGHRLGASLQNSLTCDPTHTYGPVLQYYDSACYVTGLNYRMQILRERLSHCAGGS